MPTDTIVSRTKLVPQIDEFTLSQKLKPEPVNCFLFSLDAALVCHPKIFKRKNSFRFVCVHKAKGKIEEFSDTANIVGIGLIVRIDVAIVEIDNPSVVVFTRVLVGRRRPVVVRLRI